MQNIIELLRQESVKALFNTRVFSESFQTWAPNINSLTSAKTPRQIIDLGDKLSNIFALTRSEGRGQGDVSGGGAAWEALICWYLNLCLIGRRTIVIKHNKKLIPAPICDAITVNYNNFVSNTESDLIAITFPNKAKYSIDKDEINIRDENGQVVPLYVGRGKYNLLPVINALCTRDFTDIEIHIIQCKTNWNDNSQIPMLWNMIYSANGFTGNIAVGRNGYSIKDVRRFTYSFATVPTSRREGINSNSTCVKRVCQISGGNYWGHPTENNVASSIKEMLQRNFASGHENNHLSTLLTELANLNSVYNYLVVVE